MFLKKIEISGFKSFATKTTLNFLASSGKAGKWGVTAIVGPNGSGKSNVADALRWVMGEQSMKNLRGKKAEDIIFAGSGEKARLGSASVMIFLDNTDKKINLDFQEVTIGRKIFRSGESEYLINNARVRLQDVTDILAKAGVGRETYAIANQGMADSVLNATSQERRVIVEDAAGVKQYQIKKERSIRKLQTTRQNLQRTSDLMREIEPHLKILKRQSQKASQKEIVVSELKEKQTILFSSLWYNFQKEKGTLVEDKEKIGREMMNAQREEDKLSDEMNKVSKEEKNVLKDNLGEKQREIREKLRQLEKDLIFKKGRIEVEKEKEKNKKFLEEMIIKSILVDLSYVKNNIEEIRKDQSRLIERLKNVENLEELQDIREFARAIQQKLFELKTDIEKGKKEEKKEEISKTKKVDFEMIQKISELEKEVVSLKNSIQKEEEELSSILKKQQSEEKRIREERSLFFETEKKLRSKQILLDSLKDQYNEMKISLAKVEVREEDLSNQIKTELKKNPNDLEKNEQNFNRDELEREIFRLKAKMDQIGGIDPLVVEEYQETSERFDFLKRESEDLEKALLSLKKIIKEMNFKIEGEFEKAFEKINSEFSKYFKIIFGGGQAKLSKITMPSAKRRKNQEQDMNIEEEEISKNEKEENSEENKKEIGIEIVACPLGKRISNLSMLSGGERSLTSLALLFSIVSYNPPPFAIMDEVEAALDEANSKRFARIIQELSKDTQFIMITHNRETMRQASILYGVTMGKDGISKLLSVKLDQIGNKGKILKNT